MVLGNSKRGELLFLLHYSLLGGVVPSFETQLLAMVGLAKNRKKIVPLLTGNHEKQVLKPILCVHAVLTVLGLTLISVLEAVVLWNCDCIITSFAVFSLVKKLAFCYLTDV